MTKIKLLSNKPLIWFHYVLLVGIIFLAHWLSGLINLEQYAVTHAFPFGWGTLFIWYYLFISFGDQLIHYILQVD